jgi:hypothetical protein
MKQLTIDQQKRAIAKLKKKAYSKAFKNKLSYYERVYEAATIVINKGTTEQLMEYTKELRLDAYNQILRLNSFKDHIIHVKSDFERLS